MKDNIERAYVGLKALKVRPGTECTLALGINNVAYTFTGRSYVRPATKNFEEGDHPADKFNGNMGMFRSLELAIDAAHVQLPLVLHRSERQVLFAEIQNRIDKSTNNTVEIYEDV